MTRLVRFVLALGLLVFCTAASCGSTLISILPGVVNDPHNFSLRHALLGFGLEKMCGEALKRSVPLRLRQEDPSIGRFFVTVCFLKEKEDKTLEVEVGGYGYAWSNVSQRISFEAGATVDYDTDFLLDGSTMYVYFREKEAKNEVFNPKLIEQPQAAMIAGMPFGPNGQSLASAFGKQIIENEMMRGFTVIRDSDGSTAFGLGVVEKGTKPAETSPYKVVRGGPVLANDRTELHANQRDYVGPLEVPAGKSLELTIAVEGAPGIDALVVPRSVGEPWLLQYTTQAVTTPPPGLPVLLDEPIYAGPVWKKRIQLAAGFYYLILDNTTTAGRTAPTTFAHDDRAALVRYGIQLN